MNRLFHWLTGRDDGSQKKQKSNDIRVMYHNLLLLIAVVTLLIIGCFYVYFDTKDKIFELLTILAIIGAFYLVGTAIGFIFAIPKSAQGNKTFTVDPSLKASGSKARFQNTIMMIRT